MASQITLSDASAEAGVGRVAATRYKNAGLLTPYVVSGEGRTERYSRRVIAFLKRQRNAGLAERGHKKGNG